MSRTKKFFYNAVASFLYQVITLVSGMIIPRVMLVAYGSEINGLVSSVSQFVSYLTLVEAGLAAASVYALYKPLAEGDSSKISAVVCESKNLYFQTGYIFSGLICILAAIYPFIIQTQVLTKLQISLLVMFLSCSAAISYFVVAKYRVLLTADQKGYIINFLNSVYMVLYTVTVVVLTKIGVDIVTLRFWALLSLAVIPVFLHFYMKKQYPDINYKAPYKKGAIKQRWDALILQFLGTVHTSFPIMVATWFTSLKDVSVYSIFNMVVMGVQQLMAIFGAGLSASFGELLAKKEYDVFKRAYDQYEFMTNFIITVMLSCTLVLLQPFVDIYTGSITDTNYHRPDIAILFVLNAIFYCIKNPQGTLISSAGLFKDTRIQTAIQAAIAIVGSLILVKPYGLAGILIARILSNVYRDIDLFIYIPRKIGHIDIKKTFMRTISVFIQIFIIWLSCRFIKFEARNMLSWLGYAVIVFAYSIVVAAVFSTFFDRDAFKGLYERAKGLVRGMVSKNGR